MSPLPSSKSPPTPHRVPSSPRRLAAAGAAAVLGLASTVVVELSIPAAFGALLGWIALPRAGRHAWRLHALLGLASAGAIVGTVRFTVDKAVPGIVSGGQQAVTRSAIWRLREIRVAQDALRRRAILDHDRDGVGSAALIGELAGLSPLRDGTRLDPPFLNARYAQMVDTTIGPASRIGAHLFIVCLPAEGGGWTARPGEPVDEERAEREFAAYAWPVSTEGDVDSVVFLDARERILIVEAAPSGAPQYVGPEAPPPCDAALGEASGFTAWHGKRPRDHMPGDVSPPTSR